MTTLQSRLRTAQSGAGKVAALGVALALCACQRPIRAASLSEVHAPVTAVPAHSDNRPRQGPADSIVSESDLRVLREAPNLTSFLVIDYARPPVPQSPCALHLLYEPDSTTLTLLASFRSDSPTRSPVDSSAVLYGAYGVAAGEWHGVRMDELIRVACKRVA
jgi:hypothetical protein